MTENKRFTTDTPNSLSEIYDDGRILTNGEVIKYINWYREDMRKFSVENEQLKSEIINVIDRKIKNNDKNPPQDFQVYSKVNRALKDVRESLRDVIEDF